MKRGVLACFGIATALLCALTLVLWEPRVTWKQELTLHFETPNGPYEASSVVEISARHPTKLSRIIPTGGNGLKSDIKGEAVVANLGNGQVVFSLLDKMDDLLRTVVYRHAEGENLRPIELSRRAASQFVPLQVPLDSWPRLVAFEALNDPSTLTLISDHGTAPVLAEGYALTRVTVGATTNDITTGRIKKVLPWWDAPPVPIGGAKQRKFSDPLYRVGPWDFLRI